MKRSTAVVAAALALAAAAALAWAFAPKPARVEVARVRLGHFEASVDEEARTRVRERYVVSAALAGTLGRLALREGDEVAAGDVVATLTPPLAPLTDARALRAQRAAVAGALAELDAAAARLARADVALAQARADAARSQGLAREGFVAPAKLDADRLTVQAAARDAEAAAATRHAAAHQLEQARAALANVAEPGAARAFAVRAPAAGHVLKVLQASEAVVALGAPLVEIGDVAQLEVVADVLTTEAVRVAAGQPVVVERWGGPQPLHGRVRRVEPGGFTKVSALGVEEQRVRVLVDLDDPPERRRALGDGFRVAVRIVVQQAGSVPLVPLGALFPQPEGGMAAFVVDGGRARRRAVAVRARGRDDAWVGDGLAVGATIVVYPPSSLADGDRVDARAEGR